MKPLKERLEERAIDYRKMVKIEREVEDICIKLQELITIKSINVSVSYYSSIGIYISDVIDFEINEISGISECFGFKWRKIISEPLISYYANIGNIEIAIYFNTTDSCIIKKFATGKTRRVSKVVYVDEQEFEYQVDCGEVEE